ncbi:MAG: response regulator [Nitrospirae bacterium]|nr:MAG: response regulator [Nitrospirota bacterium]
MAHDEIGEKGNTLAQFGNAMSTRDDSFWPAFDQDRRRKLRPRGDQLLVLRERQLDAARRVSEALFQYSNTDELIRHTLHVALDVIGADAGSVLLADPTTRQLVFRYVIGEKAALLHGTGIPWDKGIAGAVFTSGQPEVIVDVKRDARHFTETDRFTGYQSRDMIVVPLKRRDGEPIGVIEVLNSVEGQLSLDDVDILVVVSAISAAAIEQTRTTEVLQQLEDQLRHAQKMEAMGRLAGGIAHDFNNLLTIILGYSQVLLNELGQNNPMCGRVEETLKAGERAKLLVGQLLAFSRKQVLNSKVLDLNVIVSNFESMLRPLIGTDIELTTLLDPAVGHVKVDPGQFEQVIMNLVTNARDAMPQGGKVIIETANVTPDEAMVHQLIPSKSGQYVKLAVRDTGCGMNADTQAHIFEPFFTTKEPGKGTGLGLSTVYGIVKQSSGHIDVRSKAGQGSTFTIYLPRIDDTREVEKTRIPEARLPEGTETVLLVEDEFGVRVLLQYGLRLYGYTVLTARDGDDAIRISTQHAGPIHLLVTDVAMPKMNGRQLAHELVARHPKLKVLFISGDKDAATCGGANPEETALLQKPFTPDVLARKMRELLDQSS